MDTKLRQNKGITLIALVITIIVLLILAGVSIAMLTGDNGLLTKAVQAKTQTKLAEIEEEANLAYMALLAGRMSGEADSNDLASLVAQELGRKGYTIEERPNAGGSVTGISLENSSIMVKKGEEATISVKLEGNSTGSSYYALVDGEYYELNLGANGGAKISKTPTKLSGEGTKLTATSTDTNVVSIEGTTASTVTVKGGTTGGSTTVTIQYGTLDPITCTVTVVVKPAEDATVPSNPPTFSTDYGLIDVVFLNGTGKTTADITTVPNEPKLGGMTKINWTENKDADGNITSWTEGTPTANSDWYNYTAGDGKTDTRTSKWANAKNADESYFVWIPRFAYRITYYEDASYTKVTGCYDGDGMWNAIDGTRSKKLEDGVEIVADSNGNKYIIHPAFCSNLDLGGWKKDDTDTEGITGFWVAKYEMSRENSTDGTNWTPQGTTGSGGGNTVISDASIRAVSKPYTTSETGKIVSSWRSINIGNCYTNSYNYDRTKESHLMKNSEWGAVAYLTQSQYGRNGHEIDINSCSNYYPGNGSGHVGNSESSSSSIQNLYNTWKGSGASTTGNVYGIYDMSGGAYEYVAAFNADEPEEKNNLLNYGSSFASKGGASTKYETAYHNAESEYSNINKIFSVGKTGDATKEVRNTSKSKNWFSDSSEVVSSDYPFLLRGGYYSGGSDAGLFYAICFVGISNSINYRFPCGVGSLAL